MRRSLMRLNNGTIPSVFTTSRLAVRNGGDSVNLLESFQPGGRKSLLIKLGWVPVSSKLAVVNKAFDLAPIEILPR